MGLREAISDPYFWIFVLPLAAIFVAAIIRIVRPFGGRHD